VAGARSDLNIINRIAIFGSLVNSPSKSHSSAHLDTAGHLGIRFVHGLTNDGEWQSLLANADGRILATEHDGLLFTGTLIGHYAGPPLR
jgi:hypothetical protein